MGSRLYLKSYISAFIKLPKAFYVASTFQSHDSDANNIRVLRQVRWYQLHCVVEQTSTFFIFHVWLPTQREPVMQEDMMYATIPSVLIDREDVAKQVNAALSESIIVIACSSRATFVYLEMPYKASAGQNLEE